MKKLIFIATYILFVSSLALAVDSRLCNGAAELCEKRYNEITFAGSHNSMSNSDEGWALPNHYHGIERQLEMGARALNLDIYTHSGEIVLCHSQCAFGSRPLVDALSAVRTFMCDNPHEIITINFQDETHGKADVAAAFEEAGLAELAHAQNKGEPWPKFSDMIDSGKRLVVFGERGYPRAPWFHAERDFAWASPYYAETVREFSCGASVEGRSIYILSHFLTAPYAMPTLAARANRKATIVGRALRCWKESGRRPNIILFDFVSVGDVIESVSILNSMEANEAFTPSETEARH